MKYKDLVREWHKSREDSFNYKFEIEKQFIILYQKIAEILDYKEENYLNSNMKLYPISEINEEKIKYSAYSLHGAITYEKFGWSAIMLQINTIKTTVIKENGIYRFIFYIKKIKDQWFFTIDEAPYEEVIEDGQQIFRKKDIRNYISSKQDNYIEIIVRKLFTSIPYKKSWDEEYINELNSKILFLKGAFIKHLEVTENKVNPYTSTENIKTDLGYIRYEINDWCNYTFSLMMEIDINTYPKLTYLFDFHLIKKENKWFMKIGNFSKEYPVNTDDEIEEMLNDFCTFRDGFDMWLNNGESK